MYDKEENIDDDDAQFSSRFVIESRKTLSIMQKRKKLLCRAIILNRIGHTSPEIVINNVMTPDFISQATQDAHEISELIQSNLGDYLQDLQKCSRYNEDELDYFLKMTNNQQLIVSASSPCNNNSNITNNFAAKPIVNCNNKSNHSIIMMNDMDGCDDKSPELNNNDNNEGLF